MRSMARLGMVALLASLTFCLVGCHRPNTADGGSAMFDDANGLLSVPTGSPLRSHLIVQAVSAAGQAQTIGLPAVVEADPARVANILAPLAGRVAALKVALGERVKRGQVLAILASGDLAQAYADDDKALDALNLARAALDRARGVHAAGGAADKDVEAAQSAYKQAEAELTRASARLTSLNGPAAGHSRDLILAAPQNGVVTTMAVASGAQVSDPTATLMTVTNLDRVFVTANVAEEDISKAAVGTNAEITLTAYPNQKLRGQVTEADPVVQPDTRRQKVRIELPNPDGRLMPNMYATVKFALPTAGGVFVPQSALLMNNDSVSVLIEVRPWVFQRRAVKIGDETDTAARVLSGLQAGDRIVVKGGVLLND